MADKTTLTLGEACKRGFGLAWSSPGIVALGVLTEASSVLLSVGLQIALSLLLFRELMHRFALAASPLLGLPARLSRLPHVADWLIPLTAAGLTSALIVLTLRALWMGAGIRRFAERLLDPRASAPVLALGSANLLRVILVGLLFVPIACTGFLLGATLVGAAALLFFKVAGADMPRLALAALIALALAIATFVSRGVDLLFRAALVRAVAALQGPIDALAGACRLLWERLGGFVAIFLLFGFLQWMALGATSALGSSIGAVPSSAGAAAIALTCLALASAIAGALLLSYLTTAEYAAYTALDLDARGVLPAPPGSGRPAKAPRAEGAAERAEALPAADVPAHAELPHRDVAAPLPAILATAAVAEAIADARLSADEPIAKTRLAARPSPGAVLAARPEASAPEPIAGATALTGDALIEIEVRGDGEAEAIELTSREFEVIGDP